MQYVTANKLTRFEVSEDERKTAVRGFKVEVFDSD